jgi:hypothetical protein
MSLTVHMCQEVSSTYRLVTSFRTNWNFFSLPSLSLTNRAINESAFLVLKTDALRVFLRTNTEPKVSSSLRIIQFVLTAQPVRFIRLNKIVFSTFLRLAQISFDSYTASHILSVYSSYTVRDVSSIIKFVSLLFRLFCVYNSSSSSSFSRLNRTTRHSVDLTHIAFYASYLLKSRVYTVL